MDLRDLVTWGGDRPHDRRHELRLPRRWLLHTYRAGGARWAWPRAELRGPNVPSIAMTVAGRAVVLVRPPMGYRTQAEQRELLDRYRREGVVPLVAPHSPAWPTEQGVARDLPHLSYAAPATGHYRAGTWGADLLNRTSEGGGDGGEPIPVGQHTAMVATLRTKNGGRLPHEGGRDPHGVWHDGRMADCPDTDCVAWCADQAGVDLEA